MAAKPIRPWESDDGPEGEHSNISEHRSDERLIARARSGDDAAFAVLYERHVESARRFARYWADSPTDVDDIVSEAFTRVLSVIRSGGGPSRSFRMYVLTVVRRVAVNDVRQGKRAVSTPELEDYAAPVPFEDPVLKELEGSMVARAFAGLPERWRTVLWHTEVEGENPAQVAPHLGLSANGAAALAYRAREALRTAYVQEHLSADGVEGECRAYASKLASYHRGATGVRARRRIEEHLAACERCRLLLAELGEVSSRLRGLLGPVILGPASAALPRPTATPPGAGQAHTALRARDAFGRLTGGGPSTSHAVVVTSVVTGCAVLASGTFFLLRPTSPSAVPEAAAAPSTGESAAAGSPSPSGPPSASRPPSPSGSPPTPQPQPPTPSAPASAPPLAPPPASAAHGSPGISPPTATPPAPSSPRSLKSKPIASQARPQPPVAALPLSPAVVPQPLLHDADFEQPSAGPGFITYYAGQSIGGWKVVRNSVDLTSDHVWQSAAGHQSIDLNGSPPGHEDGAIEQPFDTVKGKRYKVTFDLAGNPTDGPTLKTLKVEVGGVTRHFSFDITGRTPSKMGWRPETVRFTAPGKRTKLRFTSTTDQNSLHGPAIDNVHVTTD
ncbi:choice-of-anchor C family protein [Streptantibioticus ferralitis]|uniref:Choice-of-anchor C family protein n=1 Tax=Streptantibioticus ferralitis TaxID=236510 RepID=A0ABT5Z9F3_9ACTN|nr:choice-of-anchor C family protein [Streptantibioticus ferralitis]MDF2260448.1 choice-of-anchor C family protein [Streptantibioticus ferralitis]